MSGKSVDLFKDTIGQPHALATEIAQMWTQGYTDKSVYEKRVDEVIQYLYATSTLATPNVANQHEHTTHRPKLTQVFDNLKANYMSGLMPNDSWFRFEGEDREAISRDSRQKIESYLKTKHRQNSFRTVITELVDDWILGNCIAQVVFQNESHTLPDGEFVDGYKGPKVLRISPRDIVFDIKAPSFKEAWKIVRSVKTLGQVARDIEERPDLAYQREVFDKIVDIRNHARGMSLEDIEKAYQAQIDGFGSYANYIKGDKGGVVEFLEFYGDIYDIDTQRLYKNHCITVVDRMYVIRNEPCETWNGSPTIFHAAYRKRRDNLMGMGALENLIGMQYYINHLENSKADAMDQMIKPDRVVRGDVEDEITDPTGAKTYYIASDGDVRNLAPEATILQADFKIEDTEQKMELYAGAPREAMGIRTPGEKTKFEVSELINAASRFFQYNMTQLEENFLEEILNAELYLARKYMGASGDAARIDDPTTGVSVFLDISKEDLTRTGKIKAVGAKHYARKMQLAQNLATLQSTVLASDPEVKNHFPSVQLAKVWEEFLELEGLNLVQPYGRIPEQLEAQRQMAAAQKILEEEQAIDPEAGEEDEIIAAEAEAIEDDSTQ